MNLDTRAKIILAARSHKITIRAAVQMLRQLRELKKIKESINIMKESA